ncbi:hypothetical protein ACHAP7_009734 [Fusarium lateritium]
MNFSLPLLLFCGLCYALLEEPFVAFEAHDDVFEIQGATIVYDDEDPIGVRIAITSLAEDLEQITGSKSDAVSWRALRENDTYPAVIIAATVESSLVRSLQREHDIDISDIQGKWETFKTIPIQSPFAGVQNGLLIVGSDKRGTMFGVYSLSEQSGHSPLHWWADIPATKHEKIYALSSTTIHGEPSVKYRGLFINDEAPGLTAWWAKHSNRTDYTLDSEFYVHVFDLLLRLKANFLWPAMWKSFIPRPGRIFFTDDPRNQQLADDYGIVVSTSHHEPMQRATNEWNSDKDGDWSWPTNKEAVSKFMEEGVRRAGKNESYFTLGMRGPSDGPMDAEDPVSTLKDVFKEQRKMLARYHGNQTASNQVWTIYKEVYTYYAAGLVPPDDVTLMFTDDNWGNVQRLPTKSERERSGGIGLYYHFEYVGVPKSWKWHNTNNLVDDIIHISHPKVLKELSQAYERGVDRIWIMNVGDIKPMEVPLSFSMDMAWNISNFDYDTIPTYLEAMAARDFGERYAGKIAGALLKHSHLVGMRKFEITTPDTYSIINYHEAERVLSEWKALAERVLEIQNKIPKSLQDALYHLLTYPVLAGYNYHLIVIGQARNYQSARERRNSVNSLSQEILEAFAEDWDLVLQYDKIAHGKWAGIMSTPKFDTGIEKWHPPSRDVLSNLSYVQLRQDFDYSFGNLGIYAEGSDSAARQGRICASCEAVNPTELVFSPKLPPMDRYGPQTRHIDLFHRGDHRKDIQWSCNTSHPWMEVSPTSGTLSKNQAEQRLNVSIDWSKAPDDFEDTARVRVEYDSGSYFDFVNVTVRNKEAPKDFVGFPEASNYISIEGPHFQRSSTDDVSFKHLKYLGTRSESGSIAPRPYTAARKLSNVTEAAWVDYDIYIFNTSSHANVTIYINSGLDTDPELPMKYSLTLADSPKSPDFKRILSDPAVPGDTPKEWLATVADHVWTRNVTLGKLSPGKHTLRWQVNSPEVYLEKIVLWLQGAPAQSYLGPPETMQVGG